MVVAQQQPRHAQGCTPHTPPLCIVGTPPERARPPGRVRSDRSCFHIKEPTAGRRTTLRPAPARASRQASSLRIRREEFRPSALSSSSGLSARARHHPSAHEERNATALPRSRPAPAGFYSGHTPPLRGLNHRGVAAPAPETIPAPAEVPALAMFSIRPITSVAGVTRRFRSRTSGASAPAQSPRSINERAFEG